MADTVGLGYGLRNLHFKQVPKRKFWPLLPKEEKGMDFLNDQQQTLTTLVQTLILLGEALTLPKLTPNIASAKHSPSDVEKWSQ